MPIYIYGLFCPFSDELRYIGKTINPKQRLRGHLSHAKSCDHHHARWVRKVVGSGAVPVLRILREVGETEDWREFEREEIAKALDAGRRLTNSTTGGEGLDYIHADDLALYRANHRQAMEEFRSTDLGKEQFARFLIAAQSKEARKKRSQSVRRAYRDPEIKKRMSQLNTEINARPEVKAAKSLSSKRNWKDAEYRAAVEAKLQSDEFRSKQSSRLKTRWSDPDARKKIKEGRWTAEARQEQAKRITARNRKPIDPEVLAKRNAAIKAAWARRKAGEKKE